MIDSHGENSKQTFAYHLNVHLLSNDQSDDRFLDVSTSAIIGVSVISHILSLATKRLFYVNK